MTNLSKKVIEKLYEDFDAIQQPRTPYVLQSMVVGARFTTEQQRAQCVLEMQIAYDNLRLAKINMSLKQIEIDAIKGKDQKSKLERAKLEIELEQTQRAVLGAEREFTFLFNLWKKSKHYTREELNEAQPMEYKLRLETQAKQDILAGGKISASNQEGLRQLGIDPIALTEKFQQGLEYQGRDEVENNYLDNGKFRVLLVVLTEKQALEGLPVLKGITLPTNAELKVYNIWGRRIDDGYNHAIETAIKEGCDYLVTIEDDNYGKEDSLIRLFDLLFDKKEAGELCCVGAWYPKREHPIQGTSIIVKGGHRQFLKADGKVHEVLTLPCGMSIYPVEILKKLKYPFTKTTENLSQDSYLSERIRQAGYKLYCDTSNKIKHIDRNTGEVFE